MHGTPCPIWLPRRGIARTYQIPRPFGHLTTLQNVEMCALFSERIQKGDEAMHWAVLRNALGENPVPAAFIS